MNAYLRIFIFSVSALLYAESLFAEVESIEADCWLRLRTTVLEELLEIGTKGFEQVMNETPPILSRGGDVRITPDEAKAVGEVLGEFVFRSQPAFRKVADYAISIAPFAFDIQMSSNPDNDWRRDAYFNMLNAILILKAANKEFGLDVALEVVKRLSSKDDFYHSDLLSLLALESDPPEAFRARLFHAAAAAGIVRGLYQEPVLKSFWQALFKDPGLSQDSRLVELLAREMRNMLAYHRSIIGSMTVEMAEKLEGSMGVEFPDPFFLISLVVVKDPAEVDARIAEYYSRHENGRIYWAQGIHLDYLRAVLSSAINYFSRANRDDLVREFRMQKVHINQELNRIRSLPYAEGAD